MPLSKKQRDFIEHYLACWNGAEAARRAGYSAKTAREQASRLLTHVNIKAAIESHIAEIFPKGELLTRWAEHARGDFGDFATIDEEDVIIEQRTRGGDVIETTTARRQVARLDLEKAAKAGKMHLIKSYSLTDKGQRIELYDAQAALREWTKIHGLGKDDGGILKYIDLSKLNQDQLQRIRDGEDILAVLLDKPETASGGGAGAAEARPE